VQINNRLVDFVTPPITTRDLVVHRNLAVLGDTDLSGNLSISGNLNVSRDVAVSGNVSVSGTIQASTFLPGQIISMSVLSSSDIGQAAITSAADDISIFSYSYTPKTSNSYIIYEYYSAYTVGGGNTDSITASLRVNGVEVSSSSQYWQDSQGGGGRSGVLFPVIGRYTNASLSSKTVSVVINMRSSDDVITVHAGNMAWLKITEIGR
jgi:hypothetical protein